MGLKNKITGKKIWCFAAGHIPLISHGDEPAFTSHDKIAVLNTSEYEATIRLTIYYENDKAITDHRITVPSNRIRKIRFNDLIDPLPIPLDTPFGFVLESDIEVIVQFSRMNTSSRSVAGFCTTPHCS